jgi:hypothetical protein
MKIQENTTYHIDCSNVKQYENERIVDDVTVIEVKPRSPLVLVYSPKLRANVLVRRKELKSIDAVTL